MVITNDTTGGAMSNIEKAFLKMKNNPKNCSFREIKTIGEYYGCLIVNKNGRSHFSIKHMKVDRVLTIPSNKNPIKSPYVKDFVKFIDELKEETDV